MKKNNSEIESRHSIRKSNKHHKVLRFSLLAFAVLLLVTSGAFAYQYHRLSPQNHFSHLKTLGSRTKNKDNTYKEKSGVFNVLLIGSDARKGDPAGHTDSMLLIHADLNNHKYAALSIPRDTRVYMSGYGYTKLTSVQYISQINHGSKQGVIDAIEAISNLTGVPINYYAETNFWGLQDMVNAVSGIQMKVPFDVTLTHPWYKEDKNMVISAGTHALNGRIVTEIVHERDSVPGTDYGRQLLQKEALIGIANKVMQPENITKLPTLSKSMSKFLIATNMTTDDLISIGLSVKNDFHLERQLKYYQVKGKNEVIYDDILKANNDEIILDQDQLKATVKKYFTD